MRKFLIASTTLLLVTGFLAINSQSSKADVICFPWETSCVPNGRPFTSSYFTIYAENRTNRPIWVAAHYLEETLGVNTDTL